MFKFVIISSNKENIKEYKYIIDKKLFKYDEYYKIMSIESNHEKIKQLLETKETIHSFIIDGSSNIDVQDVIRTIRIKNQDIATFILVLNTQNLQLKQKYFINVKLTTNVKALENLIDDLIEIRKIKNEKKVLKVIYNNLLYNLAFSDILYIEKEANRKVCKIVCKNEIVMTNESLNNLLEKLDNNFIKTHRSAIINKANVIKYKALKNEICFVNNKSINLVSRDKKGEIKEIFTKQG